MFLGIEVRQWKQKFPELFLHLALPLAMFPFYEPMLVFPGIQFILSISFHFFPYIADFINSATY